MCEYCEGKKYMEEPVLENPIHPVNLFEHPPVNYGRYGIYPRDIRQVNMLDHPTKIVFVCPLCERSLTNEKN